MSGVEFCTYEDTLAQKPLEFGAFRISNFQIRDAQPIQILIFGSKLLIVTFSEDGILSGLVTFGLLISST
jgi:hypothetical protein